MDADKDSLQDCFSDDDLEDQLTDVPDQPSQLPRRAGLSQPSQLRPVPQTLPFLPLTEWDPDQRYDDQPPSYIHYALEWKMTLNNRNVARQTEQDIALAPGDFWDHTLRPELERLVEKTRSNKPCKADATTITMSVTDRSERDITKRFDELMIDWLVVERQLQAWSHLTCNGKKIRIQVAFSYLESGKTARSAGRGASAYQLAERNARLDAEQGTSGGPDPWRQVYSLLRCPGPPCDRGPYCWQDPDRRKHYKLLSHHLRSLVRRVQQGCQFQTHDDVPQDIRAQLYAEEQQQTSRKRRRQDPENPQDGQLPMVINNYIPVHPGQTPLYGQERSTLEVISDSSGHAESSCFNIPGMRDDAVMQYCVWHGSKVRSETQKQQYQLARDLTLDKGLDLELLYSDQDAQFYIDHRIMEGVARRWVRDVKLFFDQYDEF